MAIIGDRLKHAWNAFLGRDPTSNDWVYGYSYSARPDRPQRRISDVKNIITTVINQIAVDCANIDVKHVRVDEDGNYKETIKSSLNNVLTTEANIDQTGREFIKDAVFSLLDEGSIALLPIDTSEDPKVTDSYQILTARVGKIVEWRPRHIRTQVYNDQTGQYEELIFEKRVAVILSNPFYEVMNAPNSTARRLMRTIGQLERMNDESTSGKLDLIVQLPYSVKSPALRKTAENRRKNIEAQLTGSKYGIAWTDATEKIIQLNRSLDNNLWEQVVSLQERLYNELGLTKAIFDGTADEQTMLNYYNRTIEPIMSNLVENMERKWISRTARSQGQAIRFFRNPFKLVPVEKLADIVDKFTRNEIASSNEFRSIIGFKPSDDPRADELRNSNLNHPEDQQMNKSDTVSSKSTEKLNELLNKVRNKKIKKGE